MLVVIVFQASVTRLIPLYAIGVFMSFTFSQIGMAKHHISLKERGWKTGLRDQRRSAAIVSAVDDGDHRLDEVQATAPT